MNRMNRALIHRAAWMAGVLLLGLLLGTCEAAGPAEGSRFSEPCSKLIGDVAGLRAIENDLNGSYCLTNGIDLTGIKWTPLGTFTGTLDGKGHTISGLTIDDSSGSSVGFFKEIGLRWIGKIGRRAIVKNIIFDQPDVKGKLRIGVLAATTEAALIENVKVEGGSIMGSNSIGGLIGCNRGIITNSYVSGEVSSDAVSHWDGSGGLAGCNSGTITNSYAEGAVSGRYAGGLVGENSGSIANSYATGAVNGSTAGGLVGSNYTPITNSYVEPESISITNSYARGVVSGTEAGGGLVGRIYPGTAITSSYFDTTTTMQTEAVGRGLIFNRAEEPVKGFKSAPAQSVFVGWDFTRIWTFTQGAWPTLAWQKTQ